MDARTWARGRGACLLGLLLAAGGCPGLSSDPPPTDGPRADRHRGDLAREGLATTEGGPPGDAPPGDRAMLDASLSYQQTLTLAKGMLPASCTGALKDFPVLVDSTGWNATQRAALLSYDQGGHVRRPDGFDITFWDAAGKQLDHDLERYDGLTGALVAWVRIPTLALTADTRIFLRYGDASVTSATANPAGVWQASYRAVWHLSETTGAHHDATGKGNHSTGLASLSPGAAAGKVAGADDFDGASSRVTVADSNSLDLSSALTLSAWIKPDALPDRHRIITKDAADPLEAYVLRVGFDNHIEAYVREGGAYRSALKKQVLTLGVFQHVAVTWDGAAADKRLRLYHNGAEVSGYAQQDSASAILTSADSLYLGATDTPDEVFDGVIDEARVSAVARDACWLGAEYENQRSPGATVTTSGE